MRQLEFNNLLRGDAASDIRVRQAIGYAIDYDGLIDGVLAGTVERAYGPLPPQSRSADPALRATAFRYDPARARDLLRQAGLPRTRCTSRSTPLTEASGPRSRPSCRPTWLRWASTSESSRWSSRRCAPATSEGRFAVALDGREAWYNDPDAHLTIGYLSSLATTAMTFRMPPDPGLDGLILQAQSCIDPARRAALYNELKEAIVARVPAVYLFSNKIIVFAGIGITAPICAVRHRSASTGRPQAGCGMTAFLLRRLMAIVPVLILVLVIVFSLVHLLPGDPAVTLLGPGATTRQIAALHHAMGLDRALPLQFLSYVHGSRHRRSRHVAAHRRPVIAAIGEKLPPRSSSPRLPSCSRYCSASRAGSWRQGAPTVFSTASAGSQASPACRRPPS